MHYNIPVIWEMWGIHTIEAEDLASALIEAQKLGLPNNGQYIEDSYLIDADGINFMNPDLEANSNEQ